MDEVIPNKPRNFGITRMRRFKVQVAGTQALAKLNMTFGVRFAWDTQECTGAGPWASSEECDAQFKKYGYFVGCNNLGSYPFPTAAKGYPVHYPEAVWYSLPGKGRCHGRPTGEDNCTFGMCGQGNTQTRKVTKTFLPLAVTSTATSTRIPPLSALWNSQKVRLRVVIQAGV